MRGLTPTPRPAQRHEDGAVAVLVALMLVLFVAMVAVAVDVGGLYLRRRELVNGSDAAALSAGADAIVHKNALPGELGAAVEAMLDGRSAAR